MPIESNKINSNNYEPTDDDLKMIEKEIEKIIEIDL
tara:strand:+ start:1097 stop:1204 length:108 start_codon:yes stop_codon:yes gene_type:complete